MSEVTCPECGQPYKLCEKCRKRLRKVKCVKCGAWIPVPREKEKCES